MVRIISECKIYLEALIRRVDPAYSCQSFRSGAWAIAPSDHILDVLVEQGIVFDMSICKAVKYDNAVIKLDYTGCEEALLPFWPDMKDARRMSNARSPIVCIPTVSFHPHRSSLIARDVERIRRRLSQAVMSLSTSQSSNAAAAAPANDYSVWQEPSGLSAKILRRLQPDIAIADLSALSFPMMKDMIAAIRKDAYARGALHAPVILENHTKDLVDFSAIERFASYVSKQADLEVITLRQLAKRLSDGEYTVLTSTMGA